MKVVRVETDDLLLSKMIANNLIPYYANMGCDPSKIVATPERSEDGVGISEVYFDDQSEFVTGMVISIKHFDVKNSQYDLLLHEDELFGGKQQ